MHLRKIGRSLAVACGLIVASAISPVVLAQQPLNWDQVKARFIASNPALKADADNVDEMKAEEITAFLRPNPQFNLLSMATRPRRTMGSGPPSKALLNSPTSVICTNAIINASCAWKARRKARASLNRSTRICNATWSLRCARHLLERSRRSLFSIWPRPTSITTTRSSTSAAQASRPAPSAQIDLDRIELLRVQYESEIENAIVNLRTAKIQLLQLLNDRTPVDQFDVTGPFDFSDNLQPLDTYRMTPLWRLGPTCRRRCKRFSNPRRITNWRCQTALPIRPLPSGSRITPQRITPMALRLSAPA